MTYIEASLRQYYNYFAVLINVFIFCLGAEVSLYAEGDCMNSEQWTQNADTKQRGTKVDINKRLIKRKVDKKCAKKKARQTDENLNININLEKNNMKNPDMNLNKSGHEHGEKQQITNE